MKGLNIKKLAAIAVGGALVGSALAPLAAAIDVSKADVVGASGAPVVNVVVGNNAGASDFVWAGNIAAKVAQLATVETAVAGGEGSATPSGLNVDLAVGGDSTYSTEYAKTYDGTSYALDSTASSTAEFLKVAGSGQLPFLTNETISYRYNGATYNIAVKEQVGLEVDADFDHDTTAVKDLVAYMKSGDFNYVLNLGNGIPCRAGTTTDGGTKFTDGDNDNVVVPFLGEEFTVQECDPISATKQLKLIKESAKTNYNEGDTIPGLTGKGSYAGEEMSVKIAAVTQTSSQATYEARFELYDPEGNLVDSQTVGSSTYLDESFLDAEGAYALDTVVYVSSVNVEPTTSKGVITMIVGKNVVTIATAKQYPYDSTDTETSNDYWKATLDFNTSVNSNPAVESLDKITIHNNVQIWDKTLPLWSENDSLTQAGKDAAAAGENVAHFLQGEETGLGYDFVKVVFDGFKYDQDKTIIKVGNNEITYTDSGGEKRTVPFYIRIPGTPSLAATEQTVYVDDADFFVKCNYSNDGVTVTVYDGNYFNGEQIGVGNQPDGIADLNYASTDSWGVASIGGDGNASTIDLNGVQISAVYKISSDNNGLEMTVDGNCSYTKTTDGTDYLTVNDSATPTQANTESNTYQTVYFDDDNSSRSPGDTSVDFAEDGVLTDTYKYRQYYSSTDDAVYLLLDAATDFSNDFSNADLNFVGTDFSEQGDLGTYTTVGASYQAGTAPLYEPYYWPDLEGFGNDPGDTAFFVSIFSVRANTTGDPAFRVHIDSANDKLVQYPNTDLSNYTADVNVQGYGSEPSWNLKARTDISSALHAGYLEYGSKAELTDDMTSATFTIPEAQIYLSASILGEGATKTVEGGETVEGVKEGETVTIAGKDISVSAINFTEGTCTVEGSTYPKIVSVNQLVYTDSPAPAGSHIIVGGYLVNKLAEDVMLRDGSTLQEALTAPGDKVAEVLSTGDIVVAGYSASDTKSAAQELISALDTLIA